MRSLSSEDRSQIQEVVHRYAWALDTGDVILDGSGPVIARFPGQSGARIARPRPAVLAPLASPFLAKEKR